MRKISGVLLALAASLALGATTVAAKDDVGCRWGWWRREDAERGQGGQMRSRASCMRPSLGLERSAFPSLPLAPRLLKSRLSHRPSTAAPRKVAAVCAST